MGALPNLGTIVVQDKGPGEDRVQNLVTEGVLHDLVLDAIRLDEPFLRLIDEKLIVSSGAVGSVPELFLEICNSLQRIGLHLCDGTFPSLSLSGGPIRCIQIREVINGFKRLICFKRGPPLLIAKWLHCASRRASTLCVCPRPVRLGRDAPSFDGRLLFSPIQATQSQFPPKPGARPCCRCTRCCC
jgi:hypothetical protein